MRGWQHVRLGDVATLQRGFDLPVQERSLGHVPIFAANGRVGSHNIARVEGPGVVTGRSGSIGKVHYVAGDFWPLNTALYVCDFHGNDPKYVSWLLRDMKLDRYCAGTGVPTLNRNVVHEAEVLLPPLDEQRRIAEILDHADELRLQSEKAQVEVDRLEQAIYVEIFGDPISNPLGHPLERLGDIGALDRGVSKHRPRNDPALLGGPFPLIQTGDVARAGGAISTFTSTYSELGLAQSRLWPAGTLCITIAANIAKTGVLEFDACFPDSVVGFTADESTTAYVRTWFTFLQATLEAAAPQSAQRNINLAILRDLPVPLPPIADRRHFHECLRKVQAMRTIAVRRSQQLDELFASLQSRAFSGQL